MTRDVKHAEARIRLIGPWFRGTGIKTDVELISFTCKCYINLNGLELLNYYFLNRYLWTISDRTRPCTTFHTFIIFAVGMILN